MYKYFVKRLFDIVISGVAIVLLSPLFLVLIVANAIAMKGNPFFIQERPGYKEKIFKLIKFRSMTCEKDKTTGELLSDDVRLTSWGKKLRSTSLDELPELINIFKGDMSLVGPRPLLVKYLPRYNEEQRHRHDVRPGLTGLAQVNGRNAITWEEKFKLDVEYVNHVSLIIDINIIIKTFSTILHRDGINSETSVTMEEFLGNVIDGR